MLTRIWQFLFQFYPLSFILSEYIEKSEGCRWRPHVTCLAPAPCMVWLTRRRLSYTRAALTPSLHSLHRGWWRQPLCSLSENVSNTPMLGDPGIQAGLSPLSLLQVNEPCSEGNYPTDALSCDFEIIFTMKCKKSYFWPVNFSRFSELILQSPELLIATLVCNIFHEIKLNCSPPARLVALSTRGSFYCVYVSDLLGELLTESKWPPGWPPADQRSSGRPQQASSWPSHTWTPAQPPQPGAGRSWRMDSPGGGGGALRFE